MAEKNTGVFPPPPPTSNNRDTGTRSGSDAHERSSSSTRIEAAEATITPPQAATRTTTRTTKTTTSSPPHHPRTSYGTYNTAGALPAAPAPAGLPTPSGSRGGGSSFVLVEESPHDDDDDDSDVPSTTRGKRRRQEEQHSGFAEKAEESGGLLRRSIASVGVLLAFALAANTANAAAAAAAGPARTNFVREDPLAESLTVTAKNEYGRYSGAALALYGLEMIVEPFRETTLTTTSAFGFDSPAVGGGGASAAATGTGAGASTFFVWKVVELDNMEGGMPVEIPTPIREEEEEEVVVFEKRGGPQVSLELTKPGGVFLLTVEERVVGDGTVINFNRHRTGRTVRSDGDAGTVNSDSNGDGIVVAKATVTISCRYVRRELRELTDSDLGQVLDAMEVYYRVSTEEGQARYGEGFFNFERLAAYHDADLTKFCYHAGVQFLTAHAAFGLAMERSLQAVNPRVSLPFWDYMIEAETVGADWPTSAIFDDDMFGRAVGAQESGHQLKEGRFGGIASITKADDVSTVGDGIDLDCHRNAYGYLGPTYNYQDLPLLTRAGSYCNLDADALFATSEDFFRCFSTSSTLGGWEYCMEKKVHGDMHALLGGAFDCNVDMQQFHLEHPEYGTALLTFVLSYLTAHYWPNNIFSPEINECDSDCAMGQEAGINECGCTCTVDAMTMSEDEVYSLTSGFISTATERNNAEKFVSYDPSSERPWGFQKDGVRLDDDATMLLLRHVVKLGCEPSAVGAMIGGASPMDPLFFMLHPLFEKGLHVLWMSPAFRDRYSFEWEDGSCTGSRLEDLMPFSEKYLGMGSGTELLTNSQLMSMFHASNPRLPYVYDRFDKWGTVEDWDFCPECLAASVGN
ncbi:unnamed protein product [Pylaiella littoralis]